MPASTCDPVNEVLRHVLSNERGTCGNANADLDPQLLVSAKRVLNAQIDFDQPETYKSTVLDNLKSKYIVLSGTQTSTKSPQQTSAEASKDESILTEPRHVLYPLESVQLGWAKSGWNTGVGMFNTGNTCYLNSTLQALFHVPALINWLVSDETHREGCEGCMVCAVAKTLLASQNQAQQQPIRPWMVSSKLRIVCKHLVPGRQEDAHEFLRYLVEAMERSYIQRFRIENLDARSKETTPLNQILGGYLRSAVRCLQCTHVSTTVQHFQDLLLDIRKAATVDDALTSYFSCERLDDLAYRCESCRRKVSAVKQFSLERAPYVLCIQLKRFAGSGGKITKHIAFKQRLDLTRFSHKKPGIPLTYKLVALVTHMGMSANCGHYTAIGLTPSGTYYEFDDHSVRSVSHQIVFNTNAYIMFYELEQESSQSFTNDLKINGKITNKSSTSTLKLSTSLNHVTTTASMSSSSTTSLAVATANNSPKISILTSSFKSNMIPTQVRKAHQSETVNGGENKPIIIKITDNQRTTSPSKTTSSLNGQVANGGGKTGENGSSKSNISRLLDSPEPQILENGHSTQSLPTQNKNGTDTKHIKIENGKREGNESVINGTSRKLVPYESDEGSTSESEETTSGSWLVANRDEASITPSANGDAGWLSKKNETSETRNDKTEKSNGDITQLMRMSHSGYGASIPSWTGGRSNLEKEVANERRDQFKRNRSDDDDLDRGRIKKKRMNGVVSRSNPGYNPFQESQRSGQQQRWRSESSENKSSFHKHYYNNSPNQRYRKFFSKNRFP